MTTETKKPIYNPSIKLELTDSDYFFDVERITRMHHNKKNRHLIIHFNDGLEEIVDYRPEETAVIADFMNDTVVRIKKFNMFIQSMRDRELEVLS